MSNKGTLTPNVLITSTKSDMLEIFKEGNTLDDFHQFIQNSSTSFLSNYKSPRNIVSLEHSFGYEDGGAGGGAPVIKLSIIDPEVDFENRFVKNADFLVMATEAFGVNIDLLQTREDFLGSPFGSWWQSLYLKKQQEAFGPALPGLGDGPGQIPHSAVNPGHAVNLWDWDEKNVIGYEAWAPDFAGRTEFPRIGKYKNGDDIGSPSLPNFYMGFTYQTLDNPDYIEKGEISRYSQAAASYSSEQPPSHPYAWYKYKYIQNFDYLGTDGSNAGGFFGPQSTYLERFNPTTGEQEQGAMVNLPDEYKQLLEDDPNLFYNLEEETTAEIIEKVKAWQAATSKGATSWWIAYGLGNDLDSWAGPFRCTLMNADNKYTAKGLRSLELEFVAGVGGLGSGQRDGSFEAGFGKRIRVGRELTPPGGDVGVGGDFQQFGRGELNLVPGQGEGHSVQRTISLYNRLYGEDWAETWKNENRGVLDTYFGTDEDRFKPYLYLDNHVAGDLHGIITGLLANYGRQAANMPEKNVLVVLPDINKYLEELQKTILADVLISDQVRAEGDGFFWSQELDLGRHAGAEDRQARRANLRTVWGYLVLKRLTEHLGLDFVISRLSPADTWREPRFKKIRDLEIENRNKSLVLSTYKEFESSEWQNAVNYFFGLDSTGKNNKKFEITMTNTFDETFEDTIYRVLESISTNSITTLKPTIVWEQDMHILQIMEDHGVIETSDHPALIIGDRTAIDNIVYGKLKLLEALENDDDVSEQLRTVHPQDTFIFGGGTPGNRYSERTPGDLMGGGYLDAIFNHINRPTNGAFDKLFKPKPNEPIAMKVENADKIIEALPVFRSGHDNANVLSMKIDLKPYYLAGLSYNLLAERGLQQNRGTGGIPTQELLNQQEATDLVNKLGLNADQISTILASAGTDRVLDTSLMQKISSLGIVKELTGYSIQSPNDYKDFLYYMLSVQEGNRPNSDVTVMIPQVGGSNAFTSVKSAIDTVIDQALAGSVRTLPYFKLSGLKVMFKPILMMIREATTMGVKNTMTPLTEQLYSGFWTIYGFKHILNNRESYSEFSMMKHPNRIGGVSPVSNLTEEQEIAAVQAYLESGDPGAGQIGRDGLRLRHVGPADIAYAEANLEPGQTLQEALSDMIKARNQEASLPTGTITNIDPMLDDLGATGGFDDDEDDD